MIFYARNPRKRAAAVEGMCGSIREFGFKIPCLVRSDGESNRKESKRETKAYAYPGPMALEVIENPLATHELLDVSSLDDNLDAIH